MKTPDLGTGEELNAGLARMRNSLREQPSGAHWCQLQSQLIDEAWRNLLTLTESQVGHVPPLSIVAVGGYGRRELAPYSDIDVIIVPAQEANPELDESIRRLLRASYQEIGIPSGLKIDAAYRPIADLPGLDAISLASLMDGRFIAGNPEPWQTLQSGLFASLPAAEFIISKREEREAQVKRTHLTPLVVEPNLKLGAGGLRAWHTGNWVRQALGFRADPAIPEIDTLLQARNLLHLLSGRPNDLLTRHRKQEIADVMGCGASEFGSQIASVMEVIEHYYTTSLDLIREARFPVGASGQSVRGELRIATGAKAWEAARSVSLAHKLGLQLPFGVTVVAEEFNSGILDTLAGGEGVIRALANAQILDVILPELSRIRTLMPADSSHTFTVYEHTIQVLRCFEAMEPSSPFGEIKAGLNDASSLVLAILLHDVGKVDPTQPHSVIGAKLAQNVCHRFGLHDQQAELVTWLVREHLTMSKFCRLRDVMHPETAREFCDLVGSQTRLDHLTLLTWCDVRSVSDDAWTPVQESFLLELYRRTTSLLSGAVGKKPDAVLAQRRLLKQLQKEDVPDIELEGFIESLPAHYLLSTEPDQTRQHFRMVRLCRGGTALFDFKDWSELQVTDITVVATDSPGKLTQLLGVLYAHDLKLVGLRACSTHEVDPMLVDVFTVSAGRHCLAPDVKAALEQDLREVTDMSCDVSAILLRHGKDPTRRQDLLQLQFFDGSPAILEIKAPRGRGMPYRLAKGIAAQGWNILAARVGQWAGAGTAAFYVEEAESPHPLTVANVRRALEPQKGWV